MGRATLLSTISPTAIFVVTLLASSLLGNLAAGSSARSSFTLKVYAAGDSFHFLTRHDGQGILKLRGGLRHQSECWNYGRGYRAKYIPYSAARCRDVVGMFFCRSNQGRINRCRRANAAYRG